MKLQALSNFRRVSDKFFHSVMPFISRRDCHV